MVLLVENLRVEIGEVKAVRGLSLDLAPGECRALVGESGCGKSMSGLSLLDLLPPGARRSADAMMFEGEPLPAQGSAGWRQLRGNGIAMIFQNPMTSLDPTQKIGHQIAEPLRIHRGLTRRAAWRRAVALMERLAIPQAEARAAQYPFEFSGGMLQRVVIAMAIACEPRLLIADEPTTALDLSVQAEVLALLRELREQRGTALLFITHDLGVVANIADSVSVMYAGQLVEQGDTRDVLTSAAATFGSHPYTAALRDAVPDLAANKPLIAIPGRPPDLRRPPAGCAFAPRCRHRMDICDDAPGLYSCRSAHALPHTLRCWGAHPDKPAVSQGEN